MKKIDVEGRIVYVFDNILDCSDQFKYYIFAENSNFKKNNKDRLDSTISKKYLKWRCDLSEQECSQLGFFDVVNKAISKIFEEKEKFLIKPVLAYINYSNYSDVDLIHVDQAESNENANISHWTFLLYGNHIWNSDWSGETKFYSQDKNEILYSSMIKPGRALLFDGKIPHSASAPSRISQESRYTYALKLELEKQTH